jgi:AcrR family transcriptional regulator
MSTSSDSLVRVQTYRAKPKRSGYHHGDLRNELVRVAVAILEKEGPAALTLRSVARRLRVSQTAPYRHFASKELLLAAVAAEGFQCLLEAIRERLAQVGPEPTARYVEIGVMYLKFALSNPAHFRVMYSTRPTEFSAGPVADAGRTAYQLFVGSIVACQHAGEARARDPAEVAIEAWSYVHGLVSLYIEGLLPRRMDEVLVTELVRRMPMFLK